VTAWIDRAACRGADSLLFFPETRGVSNTAAALNICRACPVSIQCLEHALNRPEQHGVWGGTTEEQRHAMRRARKRKPRPPCGTDRGFRAHRRRGEEPCGACREGSPRERARRYQERQATA
jgi:WhiB family redox-sensing transcriptional regulator